jgi:hypothetical protein
MVFMGIKLGSTQIFLTEKQLCTSGRKYMNVK